MKEAIYEAKDEGFIKEVETQAESAARELYDLAKLKNGQIVVVGCSSSEVASEKIGTHSTPEIGLAILLGLQKGLGDGIYIAAQCCEHLNRALVIEADAVPYAEVVNVVPQPKAGGAFATAAYNTFKRPVVVESIRADAGIDIGCTLIGMHLKSVAVPLRLTNRYIGGALVSAARVRPKFIGGERACYNDDLK